MATAAPRRREQNAETKLHCELTASVLQWKRHPVWPHAQHLPPAGVVATLEAQAAEGRGGGRHFFSQPEQYTGRI